jgi:tryptophanyl-tRNA synthetase
MAPSFHCASLATSRGLVYLRAMTRGEHSDNAVGGPTAGDKTAGGAATAKQSVTTRRVFSGIQPSGELHIGNYLGAVQNWVGVQRRYESIFCIVDYHAITIPYDPRELPTRTRELAISLLAAGIDPGVATLFVQSAVPEHTELAWIFNTITPLGELERQTQFKDKAQRQESVAAGLLNYPVLQAADILIYRADTVPVGEDQVQHLELSREVARRWNARFAPEAPYFPEPAALLTPTRRIMGLDGQAKMSKSIGNTVGLMESPEEIWEKLRPAVTDPKRVRRTDPGTPEVCNIYHLHRAFNPPETVTHVEQQCRSAGWGCIECKRVLLEGIERELVPIRGRAEQIRARPSVVDDALGDGAVTAGRLARETMREVKGRMGLEVRS